MPITLNCTCGKTLRVADEHAGKRVKCPACNAIITPPAPVPAFEVVEDEPPRRPVAKAVAKADDDDDDRDSYGMAPRANTPAPPKKKPNFRKRADDYDDDEEDDDRPRRSARQRGAAAGADAGRRIGYILGGIVMLPTGVGLAIWGNNGEGRGATKLMIFGICLAIGGLVMLVQGITGNMPDPE